MQFTRLVHRSSLGAVAIVAVGMAALPASADVGVSVNGEPVDLSPPPIVQAGRVFVPLRGIFERLGASVVYSDGTINATGNGRDISLRIGSTQATVDGRSETIDEAPFIVGASTYVPLRFVSEALGASVNWDDADSAVSITTAGGSQNEAAAVPSYAAPAYVAPVPVDDGYTSYAPPPIPEYAQPYVPAPNEIWQPGYWAAGPYGYYWVPGTWVEPPQPGYLWTPGYWHAVGPRFAFSAGFWAISVGFYGGVNYGAGYYGHGYQGGRWYGNQFRYNTYVTHVDTTIVHNVYIDRTVIVNRNVTRIGYNGGARGLQTQATASELAAAREQHLPRTQAQAQHVQIASQDRRLLATVNHNRPPVLAVTRPLTTENRPVGFTAVHPSDRIREPSRVLAPGTSVAPIVRPAPVDRAPIVRPVPAYRAPVARPAPVYRAPVVRPVPVYRAPVVRPAPAHVAPPHVAPAVHAPADRPKALGPGGATPGAHDERHSERRS